MFYQEALPKFRLLSRVDILLTRHRRKVAATFEKAESANLLPFTWNGCLFMWGAYFCMGAYKRNVVVVIKLGAYIHGVLILSGCLLSRFYSTHAHAHIPAHTSSITLSHNMAACNSCTCSFERSEILYNAYNYLFSHELYCLLKYHREYLPFVKTV